MPGYSNARLEVVQITLMGQAIVRGCEQQPTLEWQSRHLERAVRGGIEADVLAIVAFRLGRFVIPAAAKVDGEGARHAPVVLYEKAVVVIAPCRIGIKYNTAARR